jgi:acyl dehydratase
VVKKLAPLFIGSTIRARFRLNKLETERSARANIIATRKKVTADESF